MPLLNTKRTWLIAVAVVAAAILLAASWFSAHWVQLARADLLLNSANGHIGQANEILAQVRLTDLAAANFDSEGNISRGAEAAGAAPPLLTQARNEIEQAADDARRARGRPLLLGWYDQYLAKKEETADLRLKQIDQLDQTAAKLSELYQAGPLIFSSNEQTDRLAGRLQAGLDLVTNNPVSAKQALAETASSLRQIREQLNAANAQTNFELLKQMAQEEEDLAAVADLGSELAAATAAGDQAKAQGYSVSLNSRLRTGGLERDYLKLWWEKEIYPALKEFDSLQEQMQSLETEAAAIYQSERP